MDQGHDVTAFTRDASRVESPHVRVVSGDVLEAEGVTTAIAGRDAVLVSLGAGRRGRLRAPGTKTVIDAMQDTSVRRLVCQTTLGAGDSRGNIDAFWKYIMFGALLRGARTPTTSSRSGTSGTATWTGRSCVPVPSPTVTAPGTTGTGSPATTGRSS